MIGLTEDIPASAMAKCPVPRTTGDEAAAEQVVHFKGFRVGTLSGSVEDLTILGVMLHPLSPPVSFLIERPWPIDTHGIAIQI